MKLTGYFITATGTDAGKTLICCALLWQWAQQGISARALKPALSGLPIEDPGSDTSLLLKAANLPPSAENTRATTRFAFAAPLAPPQAAARQKQTVPDGELIAFCQPPAGCARYLVEGAGGVLSPLSDGLTNADAAAALKLPVILVADSYLGAISHILTAIESLHKRGLRIVLLVLNEASSDSLPCEITAQGLAPFLGASKLCMVKKLAKSDEMWKSVPTLTTWLDDAEY